MRAAPVVLLLLVLVLPAVHASNGIQIDWAGDSAKTVQAVAGQATKVQFTYTLTLSLAQASQLRLLSLARDSSGNSVDHTADWTLAGNQQGESSRTTATQTLDSFGPSGQVAMTVLWTLPSSLPAGDYSLEALVRKVSSAQDTTATPSDGIVAAFHVTAPASNPGNPPPPPPTSTSTTSTSTSSSASSGPSQAASSTASSAGTTPASTPGSSRATGSGSNAREEVREQAKSELVASVNAALGSDAAALGGLVVVKDKQSGDVVGIEGAEQALTTLHVSGDQGVVFMEVKSTGRPILLDVTGGKAIDVARPPTSVDDAVAAAGKLTVHVEQKVGWIEVSLADTHLDRAVARVIAVDASGAQRTLPASLLWRGDGALHFLDDPTTTYTLTFAAATPVGASEGASSSSLLIGAVILLALVLVVGAIVLVRRKSQ